jgi:sarcosine oxidase
VRVAVVGAGVVGLSTTLALRDLGADVTCFEAVAPMSQRSAGASRIFRLAHGMPELVALAQAACRGYDTWSRLAGAELIRPVGTAVAGADVPAWSAAMTAAGAAHHLREGVAGLGLPVRSLAGPVLHDPAGGVLDARATGEFLVAAARPVIVAEPVRRIEQLATTTRVRCAGGWREFDACVVVAGAGSPALLAQVGLRQPGPRYHHVRLTFPLRDGARRPPCLIDKSQSWRPGYTTYQHLTGPGRWAVGAHVDPAEAAWELGRERVAATSRRRTLDYLRDNLDGVDGRIVEELYCSVGTGWGDGFGVQRSGGVLALYGDNLFKLAPVLGQLLAAAALSGDTPESLLAPAPGTPAPARPSPA